MLIGLTGKAGVGKDTVADILMSHRFSRYAFAQPLKRALVLLGLDEPASREAKEQALPGLGYSYRKAAQTLGTEWARSLDEDFWVKLAAKNISLLENTVVTDVRFENEADFIRSNGGIVWHIVGRNTTVTKAEAAHKSESGVMFYPHKDGLINNNGTIENLKEIVAVALRSSYD